MFHHIESHFQFMPIAHAALTIQTEVVTVRHGSQEVARFHWCAGSHRKQLVWSLWAMIIMPVCAPLQVNTK